MCIYWFNQQLSSTYLIPIVGTVRVWLPTLYALTIVIPLLRKGRRISLWNSHSWTSGAMLIWIQCISLATFITVYFNVCTLSSSYTDLSVASKGRNCFYPKPLPYHSTATKYLSFTAWHVSTSFLRPHSKLSLQGSLSILPILALRSFALHTYLWKLNRRWRRWVI